MTVLIGTSGWQYADWRGAFYPRAIKQVEWLGHYAQRFRTVEINASFYRLPPRERFETWARTTPDDFVLCPKTSRYLTHIKRLKEAEEPVERFLEAALGLGTKTGPALLQLPPNFRADLERLDQVLTLFGGRVPIAVEFRHDTWWTEDTRRLLSEHGAALCWADRNSKWITPRWRTADWGYVRFHEGAAVWPCYGRTALERGARDIAAEYEPAADVYVFFNNDPRGCAVRDARWFAAASRRAGLAPTRVPDASDITLVEPEQQD